MSIEYIMVIQLYLLPVLLFFFFLLTYTYYYTIGT